MARQAKLLWQVVRPGQKPVSEAIAGSVGVAGDLANMVTDSVQAWMLAALFAGGAAVALYFCLKQVQPAAVAEGPDLDEKIKCLPCDIGHFMTLSAAVFSILWMIGGGGSGIEAIGQRLGVIEQKLDVVAEDVGDIRDASQINIPIKRPKTAADHYHNAFLFHQLRGDSQTAWTEAQAMYAGTAPRKLDAAQLYYDVASAALGQAQALAKLRELAASTGDPSLTVVLARAETDPARRQEIVAGLQAQAPDYPFSWWDPMRPEAASAPGFSRRDIQQVADKLDSQIAGLVKFRELYGAQPASHWFFRPNFQGNLVDMAGQMETSLKGTRGTYDQILSGEVARKAREDAKRQFEEARAAR
ncbi:hypothetical protein FJQ54_15415 [Sandaracinobacter neustonicus]|uniref:Uncharacterized protein n=1 Tax=Sandaracinobacter neustonicus TaxID=1715348 RepID=A0A501XDN1_9SPHN|nr:hypothetical protein [Sandaracinobacter neustonicus]TPE58463.1 hypothetical protein FJQ54_15415 [Sandaracinobacter neustonicus]